MAELCQAADLKEKLFVRFAMCVDPRKPAASGVWMKARRALGIGVTGLRAKSAYAKHSRTKLLGRQRFTTKALRLLSFQVSGFMLDSQMHRKSKSRFPRMMYMT
jgi:hypothetical protein